MYAFRRLNFWLLFCALPLMAKGQGRGLPATKVAAERLPSLNIPRSGHAVLCTSGGEITVFGGHTTGFVPVQTAEWFDGEAWHTMPMIYTHDQGVVLPLSSAKVVLAGGHEQPLGIGQTFTIETYNPAKHKFRSYGCLAGKRCFASAAELDSGRVLISGTWYARDGLELWDGSQANRHIKDVTVARSAPYVLRTSRDDAIVFGELDEHGERLDSNWMVDRTDGAAYEEPFLRKWHPVMWLADWRSDVSFVGDTAAGRYAYILPVQEDSAHLAFALVDGGKFSLLPSDHAIPTRFEGRPVFWFSRFIADRERLCGYLVGRDNTHRLYVLRIGYAHALSAKKGKFVLSLYYTDPLPDLAPAVAPVLTPEGDLVLAGGFTTDNFNPTAAVYRLPVGQGEKAEASAWWPWCIAAGGLLLLAAALLLIYI